MPWRNSPAASAAEAFYIRTTMMLRSFYLILSFALFSGLLAQEDAETRLKALKAQYDQLEAQQHALLAPLEETKLEVMRRDLAKWGYPALQAGDEVVVHAGHALVWSERHHEPKWTAHIVTPDILSGNLARIDTFLADPLVKGNTALYYDYVKIGRAHV